MRCVRAALCLAQEMGNGVGRGEILLRPMPGPAERGAGCVAALLVPSGAWFIRRAPTPFAPTLRTAGGLYAQACAVRNPYTLPNEQATG